MSVLDLVSPFAAVDVASVPAATLWGPIRLGAGLTRFRLWAPEREAVRLEIEGREAREMVRQDNGWFEADAAVDAGQRYRFRLDDGQVVADPAARAHDEDVHGWSVVDDPSAYRWRTPHWRGRPWEEAVFCEVHVGLAGGFCALAERLPALAELGVTALELMPVNAFSGERNWGYDGVLPYAPEAAYGTADELRSLIDTAHGLGLMVFLDVVYNHFGPDGNYLGDYAPAFFDQDIHTPWGAGIAFGREEVARYFIDNARMWIEDYRFDGLRLDAVHAIGDVAFLDRLAHDVRAAAPDRHVHLVLENEENDPERLGVGLYDAQWNDDFHHVLHVLLTGETRAYYRDYADHPTERLVRCLDEGFVYQGERSACQGAPRGGPSGHLMSTRFVSFLQNHDQIGNRAFGERLIRLAPEAKLKAATALLLLCPQIPLLFMGEIDGSESPFLFFTDFHDELADAVREGRRKEFAGFPDFADPRQRAAIPDPNCLETFEASRVEPGPQAVAWRAFHRELLNVRREWIMPRLHGACSAGAMALGEGAVVANWTLNDDTILKLAVHLGDAPVSYQAPTATPLFVAGRGASAGELWPDSLVAWLEPPAGPTER